MRTAKPTRALLAVTLLTVLALTLNLFSTAISIFASEWISLGVIGIHFILEAAGAIRFN